MLVGGRARRPALGRSSKQKDRWADARKRALDIIGSFFWLVLVCGLCLEIKEAVKSEMEVVALELQIAQTKTNVAKIDPLNQPLSDVLAFAKIDVNGSNFIESPLWGSPAIAHLQRR